MSDEYHPIGTSFDIGRAVGNGFAAIRIALAPMWLAGLLMMISDGGCSGSNIPTNFDWLGSDDDSASVVTGLDPLSLAMARRQSGDEYLGVLAGFVVVALFVGLIVGLAMFALNCWATTGFIRTHVSILENASDDVAPLFSGKDRFRHMAGYKLLSGFGISAAFIIAAWPGALLAYTGHMLDRSTWLGAGLVVAGLIATPVTIFVGISMYLGEHAVALEGASPVHALRRSWALVRGNRFPLIGFVAVMWLIQFASFFGIILCCIGLLATAPLAISLTGFAKTEGFLLFTRGHGISADWALWNRRAHDEALQDRPGPGGLGGPAAPVVPSPPAAPAPPAGPAGPAPSRPDAAWEPHVQPAGTPPKGPPDSNDDGSQT